MIDDNLLKSAIILRFGNLKKCAEALKVDESTLTRLRKKKSTSFLHRLKNLNVDIPAAYLEERRQPNIEDESGIVGAIELTEYPVLAEVYAGPAELLDAQIVNEYKSFEYKANSNRCFAVKVNGDSMGSTLPEGTIALVDMDAEIFEDDIVIVKLSNGNQYIKKYHNVSSDLIQLISDNPNYSDKLIAKNDIEVIYPVVEYSVKLKRQGKVPLGGSRKNDGRKGLSLT